jgi:hypothetical protein
MLRRFTVGGIAGSGSNRRRENGRGRVTDRSGLDGEDKEELLSRTCDWKCTGVGAFGRCVGQWVKRCSEERCFTRSPGQW